jgi:predicted DNA-binding transcriptional regulator
MTNLHQELQVLGLGKNESVVYEALVQSGPSKAGSLIATLDIHRNLIYQSLEKLVMRGFVTKVKIRGVWTFQITDPNSLLSAFRMKERVLSTIIEQINTQRNRSDQQIVVYEGVEGYRNFWISSLERIPVGTIDYVLGGSIDVSGWVSFMGSDYRKYNELRKKKRIVWKTIHFNELTPADREVLEENQELTEYRVIPRTIKQDGNVNIIHDSVILHTWGEPPRIIEIRDPLLVAMFKNYFDILWDVATPTGLNRN